MKVLILDDDELMADLLATVISGLYPGVETEITGQVSEALAAWRAEPADMVIADWDLPDGSGLSLIKAVRRTSQSTPVVVVTGRKDRESILAAASLGINGYLSKPFSVEALHHRLSKLIDPSAVTSNVSLSLSERLQHAVDSGAQLPGAMDPGSVLALVEHQADLTPGRLAEEWKLEVALSAKLLDVANRASLRRSGQPVQSVKGAITATGIPMALNQALALSMDLAGKLSDARLRTRAQYYLKQAETVAAEAQRIAALTGDSGDIHFTAGLLSRVGEMVALKVVQQHVSEGGELSDEDIDQAIAGWSQALGNRMKIQWRLSLKLRELVGAVHLLQKDAVSRDRLIMRAAALLAAGDGDSESCRRLLRRLGLEEDQGVQENGSKGNS